MEEIYKKIESSFYKIMNITSIAGFYIGGMMQINGMNANHDKLLNAGLYTTLLSGGYWLGRKFAEKQFKKATNLEDKLK